MVLLSIHGRGECEDGEMEVGLDVTVKTRFETVA